MCVQALVQHGAIHPNLLYSCSQMCIIAGFFHVKYQGATLKLCYAQEQCVREYRDEKPDRILDVYNWPPCPASTSIYLIEDMEQM